MIVQVVPDANCSEPAQLSLENLYSCVPGRIAIVASHTPSALASVIGLASPDQLLKVPLT